MKIRTWLPNVVESVVIFAGGAANALLSMKGFSWAAVVITSALVVGESFMSLDQTYEKTQELDKKLTTNGGQKLTVLERVWYWIAPSIGLGLTVCLLPVYGYYNIAVPDLKWWINIPIAGGATIILPCIRKIVDWRLRKRIEAIEVQPDPRIGELRAEITGLKWDFVVSKREELNGLAEQQRQEIAGLRKIHNDALDEIKRGHQERIRAIEDENNENIQKIEETHLEHLSNLTVQHQEQISGLTETINNKQQEFDVIINNLKFKNQEAIYEAEERYNENMHKKEEVYLKEKRVLEERYTETINRKQQELDETIRTRQQMIKDVNFFMVENRRVLEEKEILQRTTEEQAGQVLKLHAIIEGYGRFFCGDPVVPISTREEGSSQSGYNRERRLTF